MKIKSVRCAFTLVELIFVIVIIGVLSAVAIPKFANLTDNSKSASELATASSVQSALDSIHGEWIANTCDFDWGNGQNTGNAGQALNATGYPTTLGSAAHPLDAILKNTENGDWVLVGGKYYGPATKNGTSTKDRNIANKPEGNDYWEYNATTGTFKLIEP
ncbi:type II secretion system protein [Sulfuricurvum sp.]|uniref:type II secretion system protein n=1 Tax=Sulfuricurvum sp. TaxID=2025608 RepID=UPI0026035B76|nr:type II secretion system protein [Sulfuricurvum sp.]MDD2780597.1 type II secretion system protein [Sulfuricurvum sp.]